MVFLFFSLEINYKLIIFLIPVLFCAGCAGIKKYICIKYFMGILKSKYIISENILEYKVIIIYFCILSNIIFFINL